MKPQGRFTGMLKKELLAFFETVIKTKYRYLYMYLNQTHIPKCIRKAWFSKVMLIRLQKKYKSENKKQKKMGKTQGKNYKP
jgi:hypothetical protein